MLDETEACVAAQGPLKQRDAATVSTRPADRVQSRGPARYRCRTQAVRDRQIKMRYTQEELDEVAQAAAITGLTPSGYAAEAALAAARGLQVPSLEPWRAVLSELIQSRAQVRRIGVNVNQAAAVLNSSGQPPVWLERALELANRAVVRVEEASETVARLTDRSRRTSNERAGTADRTDTTPDLPGR